MGLDCRASRSSTFRTAPYPTMPSRTSFCVPSRRAPVASPCIAPQVVTADGGGRACYMSRVHMLHVTRDMTRPLARLSPAPSLRQVVSTCLYGGSWPHQELAERLRNGSVTAVYGGSWWHRGLANAPGSLQARMRVCMRACEHASVCVCTCTCTSCVLCLSCLPL